MFDILETIEEWIKGLLTGAIKENLTGMFNAVNTKVNEVADIAGQTPQGFNAEVFNLIRNLSETVIIPVAGIIITFVLCYELISMLIEKNNMHDFDTFNLYKWIFKAFVAVYLVTNTFPIIMAVFDLSQNIVNQSASVIGVNTNINIDSIITSLESGFEDMGIPELFGLMIETLIVRYTMNIVTVCVFIVVYGRMVQIYIFSSVGAIPLSTMANREWGSIGQNYIKGLLALGFQGFFMMVCLAIYAVLIKQVGTEPNIHIAIWNCVGYTILLCFTLFQTGTISKSIFNSH